MTIRNARLGDLEKLRDIEQRVIISDHGGSYPIEAIEAWAAARQEGTLIAAGIEAGHVIVAEGDTGRVVGFCHFMPSTGTIETLCVDVPYQYEGFGRALVREALRRARQVQLLSIHVQAALGMVEFFQKLDFDKDEPGQFVFPHGSRITLMAMSRPVNLPFITERIAALEESIAFYGAGRDKQQTKERYVAEGFLRGLAVAFESTDVLMSVADPPDAIFQDARFEVKELYEKDRRRGDEYKAALARAKEAFFSSELLDNTSPIDISLDEVVGKVCAIAIDFAGHYKPAVLAGLDLLVYANLAGYRYIGGRQVADIGDLASVGWRSVSYFRGSSTSCVLIAHETAPDFLRRAVGKLHYGEHAEDS